jgi:hypothetical protein
MLQRSVHLRYRGRDMSDEVIYEKWENGMKLTDNVNHPAHYTSGGIETIDYMEAKSTHEEFCGHLRLTAIKYLSRAGLKDDEIEDYGKAIWYITKLIETRRKYGSN